MQSAMLSHRLILPNRPRIHKAGSGSRLCQVACSVPRKKSSPAIDTGSVNGFSPSQQALLSTALLANLTAAADSYAAEATPGSQAVADASASISDFQQTVQDGASQIAEGATPVPPWATGLVVFSPLILYGIFVTYRAKVNPRATLTDFAFIIAAVVIVLNLISILVFKIRLF